MIYILDTTSVSDWMNERPAIAIALATLSASDEVIICPVVRGEIIFGIQRLPEGKRRQRLEARAEKAFAKFGCRDVPECAGDHYARLRIDQEKKGLRLGENDLWIAATALALAARLISGDGDFARIEGLNPEDWTR